MKTKSQREFQFSHPREMVNRNVILWFQSQFIAMACEMFYPLKNGNVNAFNFNTGQHHVFKFIENGNESLRYAC